MWSQYSILSPLLACVAHLCVAMAPFLHAHIASAPLVLFSVLHALPWAAAAASTQINAWFLANRNPETGEYPDLPSEADGGSKVILRPPMPSLAEVIAANAAAGGNSAAKAGGKGAKSGSSDAAAKKGGSSTAAAGGGRGSKGAHVQAAWHEQL